MTHLETARRNFARLSATKYTGRGLILGTSSDSRFAAQVYWASSRSERNKNRVFSQQGTKIFTEAADEAAMEGQDTKNIIYTAMEKVVPGAFAVTNGDHTETICQIVRSGISTLDEAMVLEDRQYEDDAPNYTQRIAGMSLSKLDDRPAAMFSILRKSEFDAGCDRMLYRYRSIPPGIGRCITTYVSDGKSLPAFMGEPITLPLDGSMKDVAEAYWASVNPDYRIALAVRFIEFGSGESETLIVNARKKVVAVAA